MDRAEAWKPVAGYEGIYEVSNMGNIRRGGKFLKGYVRPNGYVDISLSKDGGKVTRKLHRLVADAFVPNPENAEFINHKNEIKTDNRAENLEWCSFEYNVGFGTGRERSVEHRDYKQITKIKEQYLRPINCYNIDGSLKQEYPSAVEAEKDGFDRGSIHACCIGLRFSHKSQRWAYKGNDLCYYGKDARQKNWIEKRCKVEQLVALAKNVDASNGKNKSGEDAYLCGYLTALREVEKIVNGESDSIVREQEQREQGCEFCQRFDFTSARIEVNKYGAHICLATAGTVFATNERFNFCPMCGRKLGGAEE